ncbi:hypothetical protein FRC03_004194, partial [Tulasnella sp. 419]
RYDDLAWLDQVVTSIAENDDVDGRHSALVSVVKDINSALKRASSDKSKDDTKNIDDVIKFSTQCIMKGSPRPRPNKRYIGGSPEPQHLEQRLSKLEASTVYGIDATSRPIRGKEKVMFKLETIPEPASNIDASRAIKLPEVNPGYLVFQRSEESDKTYIRDLKPKGDNREYAFPLSTRILAVNETRTMLAFYTDDDNRNYVKLSSIPFDANSPSCEIEVEEKVVHIFWLQPNLVGFLSESGGFYTSDVSSKDGDYVLEPAQLLFQLPTGAVIKRDRLNISMASTEDEVEWLAFNTVVNDGPIVKAQVYIWSQKSLQGTLLDGIGTLTQMNIDDKPRNLLIMTSRKASSQTGRIPISLVVYDLDHSLVKRPFPITKFEVDSLREAGKPSFIHVFQPQGVALIVVTTQSEACAILCDVRFGFKLQESQPHVTWWGTFSPEKLGAAGVGCGLLVLQPASKTVERVTLIEEVLKQKRIQWISKR